MDAALKVDGMPIAFDAVSTDEQSGSEGSFAAVRSGGQGGPTGHVREARSEQAGGHGGPTGRVREARSEQAGETADKGTPAEVSVRQARGGEDDAMREGPLVAAGDRANVGDMLFQAANVRVQPGA